MEIIPGYIQLKYSPSIVFFHKKCLSLIQYEKINYSFNSYPQSFISLLTKPRDLGVPFNGTTGEFNSITDVKSGEGGYSTIISESGENIVGKGPVRTGVTAIFPRGKAQKFSPCLPIGTA